MKATVNFAYERETKNTIRFAEVVDDDLSATKIGSVYVSKPTLKELGWTRGNGISVTINVK